GTWEDLRDQKVLVFRPVGALRSSKCACFDMDGTLITTKSGKSFPEDANDWKLLYPDAVLSSMKELYEDGYRCVVFSNQRGLATGKETKNNLQHKFTEIMKQLSVPMTMYLSYGLGIYRKPCDGLWTLFESENGALDRKTSFYVGDAAGRPKNWQANAKKDHSKVDRLFALNFGIRFYTPEEFFLKRSKAKFEMPEFDPKSIFDNRVYGVVVEPAAHRGTELTTIERLISDRVELIVLVGYPASGKTTLAREMIEARDYMHVNQDKLGSLESCLKAVKQALEDGKRVIVDNTNVQKDQRKSSGVTVHTSTRRLSFVGSVLIDTIVPYMSAAASLTSLCLCDSNLRQVRHNNKFRLLTGTDSQHQNITDKTLYSLRKRFQQPDAEEGFDQIVVVKMVPQFENDHLRKLYFMYLLEE
ncbi:bifunctional polynucleotide phosphatase/kinase-like, partial [Tropilaelaps mercedesae]